jgi:hypothetical protein
MTKLIKLSLVSIFAHNFLYGALTKTEVSELYVSLLNRASEGEGNRYWQTDQSDMVTTANVMLDTQDSKEYFGTSLDTNKAFIEHIYKNTLNKDASDDPEGIDYWVNELNSGKSRGEVVTALINAVLSYKDSQDELTKNAYNQFINRVDVSDYTADHLEKVPENYKEVLGFDGKLRVTADPQSVESAKSMIDQIVIDMYSANQPPVAEAGDDITIQEGEPVTFDASASYDSDDNGSIVEYKWTCENNVFSTTEPIYTVTLTDMSVGEHTCTLTVTDNDGATATDTVKVIIEDSDNGGDELPVIKK